MDCYNQVYSSHPEDPANKPLQLALPDANSSISLLDLVNVSGQLIF